MKSATAMTLVLLCCLLVLPHSALAYVDPGTGSFLIQGLIAAVVGAGVALKLFWHRIKSLITGTKVADDEDDD